jgi:hypothetical protein
MGIRDILVNGTLGFGAAPLGNMFRDIPNQEAVPTVDAAWEHGTRGCTSPQTGEMSFGTLRFPEFRPTLSRLSGRPGQNSSATS